MGKALVIAISPSNFGTATITSWAESPWLPYTTSTTDADGVEAIIDSLPLSCRATAHRALRDVLRHYQNGMAELLSVMEKFFRALEDARRRARLRPQLQDAGWPLPAAYQLVQPGVFRRVWRRWKAREPGSPSWARRASA